MLLYELMGGGVILAASNFVYGIVMTQGVVVPPSHDLIALLFFASLFTIVPFLLQLQALRSISAFTVTLNYHLEPIYTIILAFLLFSEAGELSATFWGHLTHPIVGSRIDAVSRR